MGKLLNIIKVLTLVQKRDLSCFIGLASNRITGRDKEVFAMLLDLKPSTIEKTGEGIWECILSKEELSGKNRMKHRLLKAVERYIMLLSAEANGAVQYYLLADYYLKNNIQKNTDALLKKGISELQERYQLDDKVFLFWLYQLSVQRENGLRQNDTAIDLMNASLNDFYICNKIRIICEKLNRHNIINQEKDLEQEIREIEKLIENSKAPEVELYAALLKLLTTREEQYFTALDTSLKVNKVFLGKKYINDIYVYLLNFCIRKINNGHLKYAKKYFEYIKALDSMDLLLVNKSLGISRFKNILLCSIIIGETQWTKLLFEKYSDNLSAPSKIDKESFLLLNQAIVEFYNDNIELAFNYVRSFRDSGMYDKDLYYRIACDKLLLKIYYELNEIEAALRKIESIRNYIKAQKRLKPERIHKQINFLKVVAQLVAQSNIDKELKDELLIPDRIWLEKMVNRNGL